MRMVDFFVLMERVLDKFSGTSEEFGALLETAISRPIHKSDVHYWPKDYVEKYNREIAEARKAIAALPDGQKLLNEEFRRQLTA